MNFFYPLLFCLSFNVFAENFSSVEEYKENFSLLKNDINKLEKDNQLSNNSLKKEMLETMYLFRKQFDYLSNPLKLEVFSAEAKTNGWETIAESSKDLISTCEIKTSIELTECKNGLIKIKNFILNSKFLSNKKDAFVIFVDNYLLQLEAQVIINDEFVNTFNKRSSALNLINKKNDDSVAINISANKEFVSINNEFEEFSGKEKMFFITIILLLLVGAFVSYYKIKIKRRMKAVYYNLFTIAKINNLQLKMYGRLRYKEVNTIEPIQLNLLKIIKLSRAISRNLSIKFKNDKGRILIEVNYVSARAIQNIISLPKEKLLNENMLKLQEIVENSGGEFIFMNQFNSFGDLVESGFSFYLNDLSQSK